MSLIAQLLGFPHERAIVDSLANAIVSRFTYLGCDVEHDLLATVLLATINADACHEGNLLRSHPELLFETSRGNTAAEHGDIDVLIHERSEEHTSELQSLMRISYAVFCLKKKKTISKITHRAQKYKTDK